MNGVTPLAIDAFRSELLGIADHVWTLAEIVELLKMAGGEMSKGKQEIVSADLSQSLGLFEWFEKFKKESGLNDSGIVRKALNYYRASTGPDVVLLQKRLSKFESAIGGPKYGWRGEVDQRLETLERRSQ